MSSTFFRLWVGSYRLLLLGLVLAACSSKQQNEPGSGSGSGSGLVEVCDNGVDDDADGDVDCADVSCTARAPDPSAPTAFGESVAWLHATQAGSVCGPLQQGVAEGALDPLRVSVVRGQVTDAQGEARAGARVTVVGAPQLGSVRTRADGLFDIAVNGGAAVTLEVWQEGFLRAHRRAQVPAHDFAWVEPVALKALAGEVAQVTLGAGSAPQWVRALASTDGSGTRQPALWFPAATQALQQNTDGSESPLENLSVRITEYTVGERGPQAMPADLPPASAYTFAFELSVDEADAAGARGVRFDQPVPLYMENFLGFPVGTPVPVGYYNRERAAWEALENGVVLGLVAEPAGSATLDLDGDGTAETAAELSAAGISADELRNLASLYEPGQTLWRTAVTHFSAYDHNWPFGFPLDAIGPPDGDQQDSSTDTPGCASGSILRIDNRSLGEAVALAGTGYALHYQSDRTPGGQSRRIDVAVSEAKVPPTLKRIETRLEIAGLQLESELAPEANQRFSYDWDGRSVYGFPVQGSQPFTLRVGYVYDGVYTRRERADTRSFGKPGEVRLEGNRTRREVTSVREITGLLGGWDARGLSLGGFSLDVQHVYDPRSKTLLLGDGSERTAETVPFSLVDVLAEFEATPDQVLAHPDGRVFISEDTEGAVYVFQNGQLTLFAGGGTPETGIGDGGPATQAILDAPQGMALGADGSLFVVEGGRVRRVDRAGIITTLAGGGSGTLTEGEVASGGSFSGPDSIALGPDGALYVADLNGNRVWRVDPNGTVSTFAGTGRGGGELGDGGPATLARLDEASGLAFAPDGSLYLSERAGHRIRRVAPDGTISTVAGTGAASSTGDGGPAVLATINTPRAITFDSRGNLLFSEEASDRVRQIGSDGIITTLADSRSSDGALNAPDGISIGPDGSVYVVSSTGALLRLAPSLPHSSLDDLSVASADGSELYRFNRLGKHLATIDTLTGHELRRFEYDAEGRLSSVVEESLRTTRFEREASGAPRAIVSPYGVRTELQVNADGFLSEVRDALGGRTVLEYARGGLLTRRTDVRGGEHVYGYDERGRLVSDQDPSGASQRLVQSGEDGSQIVVHTTGSGRSTRHIRRRSASGGLEQRTEDPSGAVSVSVREPNGNLHSTLPDGTLMATTFAADPRFGAMAPLQRETVVTLPSGLETTLVQTRTAELLDPKNPLSLTRLSTETRLNRRAFLSEYDAASRTLVETSPAGRTVTSVLDDRGRLSQVLVPGLETTFYEYDAEGRLSARVSGEGARARRARFEYSAEGWLSAVTNALGQTTSIASDALGRTTRLDSADGASTRFGYDAAGSLTLLTPPGQAAHALSYDARGLLGTYTPPELSNGATPSQYEYDADGQLVRSLLPGLAPLVYTYGGSGLLESATLPEGELRFAYDPAGLRVVSASAPSGVTLAYDYDGSLETLASFAGPVQGQVARTYNADLFVTGIAVNGTHVAYTYDADGLITRAGNLRLAYDAANGLLTSTELADTVSTHGYTSWGELATLRVTTDARAVYGADYSYDALGRISAVSETLAGTSVLTEYSYDPVGQLTQVLTDGVVTAGYSYDPDGNRRSVTSGTAVVDASYDAQERLLSYGDSRYTYSPRGTLESRRNADGTTSYTFDSAGNLSAVTLASGSSIGYLSDALGRRVQRSVDGAVTHGWLYQNELSPVAELDAAGTVLSRFVYASSAHVPDFMLRAGTTYRIISDLRGSVRLVVNAANGSVAQRIDYGPFGEVIADTSPGFQPFGFAGGLYDPATGLVRFGARDYDPEVGRWTSKDPIAFGGGQANLYAYVGNDPVNAIDPSGAIVNVVGGAAAGAGLDLAIQLIANGGRIDCVNWTQVGGAGLTGAAFAGIGPRVVGLLRGLGARGAARGGGAIAGAAEREATGFLGKSGYELQNLQAVRNTATTIEGRAFSGHALDQMQNRGIMPSVVQNTFEHGSPFATRAGTSGFYDAVNNLRVILNSENGTVVTVIRGSP